MTTELVRYEAACRAIADAKSVDEAKELHDKAEALRAYARQAKNKQLEVDAAEIRMRAQRRLGEMIGLAKDAKQISRGQPPKNRSESEQFSRVTLEEAGIDRMLSVRAQRLAAVPQERFEELISDWRERIETENERVTVTLLREGQAAEDRAAHAARTEAGCTIDDLDALIRDGKRFHTIYADPPWDYLTYSKKGRQRSADRHYDVQSLDDIKALPVGKLAAIDCVLLMWAVMPSLPQALEVITAWGFAYKTVGFTWVKQNKSGEGHFMGMGHWTRANAELCLLATRGAPARIGKDVRELIVSPLREHSQKPDEAYERIEQLVAGPYLELFARAPRDGWVSWGNEIAKGEMERA